MVIDLGTDQGKRTVYVHTRDLFKSFPVRWLAVAIDGWIILSLVPNPAGEASLEYCSSKMCKERR